MNYIEAKRLCENSGLFGWDLVHFVQKLVNANMKYSVTNSFDKPITALEKGEGYCWHQAWILNMLLNDLGVDCKMVHSFKNYFPSVTIGDKVVKDFVSGHVWCKVTVDSDSKDVCAGSCDNFPGKVTFTPLGKIRNWSPGMDFLTYYGAALVNYIRKKTL